MDLIASSDLAAALEKSLRCFSSCFFFHFFFATALRQSWTTTNARECYQNQLKEISPRNARQQGIFCLSRWSPCQNKQATASWFGRPATLRVWPPPFIIHNPVEVQRSSRRQDGVGQRLLAMSDQAICPFVRSSFSMLIIRPLWKTGWPQPNFANCLLYCAATGELRWTETKWPWRLMKLRLDGSGEVGRRGLFYSSINKMYVQICIKKNPKTSRSKLPGCGCMEEPSW